MRKFTLIKFTLILVAAFAGTVLAQTTESPVKPVLITGEVVSVTNDSIVLNTKDGATTVSLTSKTEYKRVSAESPSLKTATPAAFADIGVGDKLAVTGIWPADRKTLPARSVYLMTKADIAMRNTKEAEEWKTRGITGRVSSVDPVAKKIGIEVRGFTGSTTVEVTTKDNARFMRYAPNSVKYDEAKPGTIADINPGDMLRALGDKGTDGTTFAAEEIVTGAFQTVAGTVKSVDAAKNEVLITDLKSKKDMTIAVGSTSLLKKFPEEMAQRMAQFQGGGQGTARPAGQSNAPEGARPQGSGQGRGFGQRGGGGIDEMLDRFPTITVADLKPGDMIAVSSTKNDTDHITAIKLLAGVEPFLRAAQAQGGRQGRGGNQGLGDFNIPGLDGFGTP
ncbi:MAG TPA: hypothetical protein VL325_03570 [Pyrinomonadaceae bacterium]|nr:hypothetical protein [Pyrinomonadaceae bacterium]